MIKYLKTSILFILQFLTLMFAMAAHALVPVKLEVKNFDGNTVFILYHHRDQVVEIKYQDKLVNINSTDEMELEILNPEYFNQFATQPKLSQNNKSIIFSTNSDFAQYSIINGEKLTAIKLNAEIRELKELQKIIDPPKVEEETQSDSIKYSVFNNKHTLSFNFSNPNVGMAAFVRGPYLWVVFDQTRIFNFDGNNIFSNFTKIHNPDATVFRTKVPNNSYIQPIKNKFAWDLIVSTNPIGVKNDNIDASNDNLFVDTISDIDSIKINGNFTRTITVTIDDPEIGDVIKVVPLNDNHNISQLVEFVDFSVIPSLQGAVVTIANDEVDFIKNDRFIQVTSKHESLIDHLSKSSEIEEFIDIANQGTLLPIMDKRLDIINFNEVKSRLIREITLLSDDEKVFIKRFELAKFFFKHGWYDESLALLEISENNTPQEYYSRLDAQFLAAVNATIIGKLNKAATIYNHLITTIAPVVINEIELWKEYNTFLLGEKPNSLHFLSNLRLLSVYPDDLYWQIALEALDLSLFFNDLKTTDTIFNKLRNIDSKKHYKYSNSVDFYKANYYRKKQQWNLAEKIFIKLTNLTNDPFNVLRSTIALARLQVDNDKITKTDAINNLNQKRFTWRGDRLEYNLLMLLAEYYYDNAELVKALRTYMYIYDNLGDTINNFYITLEMVKIFNNIFLPGGFAENMDLFTAVALFYEFKDITPIGKQGDAVISSIVKMLIKLDLLEQAGELLSHQVDHRLIGAQRIDAADRLAIVLLMNDKPQDALNVLYDTDKDNVKFDEYQYRLRLKAQAFIALQEYNKAISYIVNDLSQDAETIRKEALFRSEQWDQYIELVQPNIDQLISDINENAIQDITRLTIAYYIKNKQIALKELSLALKDKNELLKSVIDLLLTSSAPIDYKNLDKSLNINQMQKLLDKYKTQIID